jgi:hypothetical protein
MRHGAPAIAYTWGVARIESYVPYCTIMNLITIQTFNVFYLHIFLIFNRKSITQFLSLSLSLSPPLRSARLRRTCARCNIILARPWHCANRRVSASEGKPCAITSARNVCTNSSLNFDGGSLRRSPRPSQSHPVQRLPLRFQSAFSRVRFEIVFFDPFNGTAFNNC